MTNFIVTKYGTKINTAGLTPQQIQRVRATAENNGAYGAKGTALANTFRKQSSAGFQTAGATTAAGGGGFKLGTTPEELQAQLKHNQGFKGANTVGSKAYKRIQRINAALEASGQNPGQDSNYLEDSGKISDPNAVVDKVTDMTPGADDLQGDVEAARKAAYDYTTQYYAQDKSQEIEAAKQELANRGIPIDPSEGSLWQKTLQGIDRKYQNLYDQATNQSIAQGNQILQTEAGVGNAAASTFLQAVLGLSDQELQRFGITQEMKARMAAIAKSGSGSSGRGAVDTSVIIGGTAPGFI